MRGYKVADEFDLYEAEARRRGLAPISGGAGEGEGEPPLGETPPVPAPSFVPTDDFKRFQEQIGGTLSGIRDAMTNIAAQVAPKPAAGPVGVRDEEIEEALRTGTGAAVIRRAINEGVEHRMKTEVQPQFQQGLEAISRLTQDNVTRATKPDGKPAMPYYGKYRAEIDNVVEMASKQNPGLRLDAATYQWAHDMVAGRHAPELVAEAIEQANRAGVGAPQPPTSSTRPARTTESGRTPTVEELYGKDAADALDQRGLSPDQHAQKLGYKDWATLVALEMSQRDEVTVKK